MSHYEDWYVEVIDEQIEDMTKRRKDLPDFKEFLSIIEVLNVDLYEAVNNNEEHFLKWFSKKTKHKVLVGKYWTPVVAEEEKEEKKEEKPVSYISKPNGAIAISSDGTVVNAPATILDWHEYMNQILLDMANYLGRDYMPIIADLTVQITGKGYDVLPSFSFVIHPNEVDMYKNVETAMKHVINTMRQKRIQMNNLKGVAKLVYKEDGRHMFFVSIDPAN